MKGIDAAVWNVSRALGLAIRALPVHESDDGDDSWESESNGGRNSPTEQMRWDPFSLFGLTGASQAQLSSHGPKEVGAKFMPMQLGSNHEDGLKICKGIHWLNVPKHTEVNATYFMVTNPAMPC